MHARIEHLLSLRDGEPVAADVREHVAHCRACAAALQDAIGVGERLRALPVAAAAPHGWEAVRQKMAGRAAAAERRAVASRIVAAASVAVIAIALWWRAADDFAAPAAVAGLQAPLAVEEALAMDRVAQLQTQSHALEDLLSAFGDAPAVERAGTAVPIDTLEAQVQWIDHQLSAGDGLEARVAERLWRERVDLMNSLVQLRYADAQRIAM
jgi:hypothetical protein